jgi:hypothetical protein
LCPRCWIRLRLLPNEIELCRVCEPRLLDEAEAAITELELFLAIET